MAQKLLRRVEKGSIFGGVCTGLAKYSGIDLTIWRLIFLFGALFSVVIPFTLIYIVMWIVVPKY